MLPEDDADIAVKAQPHRLSLDLQLGDNVVVEDDLDGRAIGSRFFFLAHDFPFHGGEPNRWAPFNKPGDQAFRQTLTPSGPFLLFRTLDFVRRDSVEETARPSSSDSIPSFSMI